MSFGEQEHRATFWIRQNSQICSSSANHFSLPRAAHPKRASFCSDNTGPNCNTFLLTPKKQCPTKETLSSRLLEITIDYFHCKNAKLLSSSFTKCTNS